jgi:hypothetical protein
MTVDEAMGLFIRLSDSDERLAGKHVEHIASVRGSLTKHSSWV